MREVNELMDAAAIASVVDDMAEQIVTSEGFDAENIVLVGIRRRGVPLARRIATAVCDKCGVEPPLGELDITLYRDDLSQKAEQPVIGVSDIPFDIDGKTLVLVDDVFYTGRTVRAALTALTDYGRPRVVWLATLIDRGWRELPIRPDIVGQVVETTAVQVVEVRLSELDGEERVALMTSE